MKQYVDSTQIKELNPVQFKKLCKLIGSRYCDDTRKNIMKNFQKDFLSMYMSVMEKTNIGKMIEIICNSDFHFPSIGLTESKERTEYIVVGITCLSGCEKYYGKTFEGENLCDALWEVVKLILLEDESVQAQINESEEAEDED